MNPKDMNTGHIANSLFSMLFKAPREYLPYNRDRIYELLNEFHERDDATSLEASKVRQVEIALEEWTVMDKTYTIRISSPFILTQMHVKKALGTGYKVSSIELEKDNNYAPITDIETAVDNIIRTGYRALARAHHPDFGGNLETMMILNKAKKELLELLESVKI